VSAHTGRPGAIRCVLDVQKRRQRLRVRQLLLVVVEHQARHHGVQDLSGPHRVAVLLVGLGELDLHVPGKGRGHLLDLVERGEAGLEGVDGLGEPALASEGDP
jgi:hypothetical protein